MATYRTAERPAGLTAFCEFSANVAPQTLGSGFDNTNTILTFDNTRLGVAASIASTSVTDFYDAGTPANSTGCHTVLLRGVDSNGDEFMVYQQLDGQTEQPITVDGTKGGTPASLIAMNSIVCANDPAETVAPDNVLNVGDVYVGSATSAGNTWVAGNQPTITWMAMGIGLGISSSLFHYQPNGRELYLLDFTFVGDNDTAGTTFVTVKRNRPQDNLNVTTIVLHINGAINLNLPAVPPILPGECITFEVDAPGALPHNASAVINAFAFPPSRTTNL